MLGVLAHPTYRKLFAAQVIALLGTGLATVALSLLAFELSGEQAGTVLGTVFAIKMVAYVFISPIAAAITSHLPRRPLLITLDLLRAAVALFLPFVSQAWQLYILIFLLQSASACFTPLYQAIIPEILEDEEQYTRALSLSRLAYDLENLLSPAIAVVLLSLTSWHGLFAGTVAGFVASAWLLLVTVLPDRQSAAKASFHQKMTRGLGLYLATPRLRGLLALNVAVAVAGAMVIVNTVVIVQARLGLAEQDTALALACFGAGSMMAALMLPLLLKRWQERTLMLAGGTCLVAGLLVATGIKGLAWVLPLWLLLGVGYALVQTPSGRLLARSAHPDDRPAVFTAQFSLSHACWLFAYPLAGWLGSALGLVPTLVLFACAALVSVVLAARLWPAEDPTDIYHHHVDLPDDHPHLAGGLKHHVHPYVIDDLHTRWPR
ncbi:MFS transporter [Oceanisphaera arctica]|uniref:MFS transporter n=1 Tax=Oceanisphaera arctica TaxID=641510 RepID=A0A2P5TID1_9GAMM|nr:MFS transporter [Oceanisphaera arctica]PPL14460.1 MFS transporter [Oceanisphaera arctica]GHA10522.1 MFS transporter [Oceanisphaera arctica]